MVAALSSLESTLTRSGGKLFISLDFNTPGMRTYAILDRNSSGMCTYIKRVGGVPLCVQRSKIGERCGSPRRAGPPRQARCGAVLRALEPAQSR